MASITLLCNKGSKDKEEIKVFQTVAAQVEQTHTKDKKWRNPTKILKPVVERRLAVLKALQTRE